MNDFPINRLPSTGAMRFFFMFVHKTLTTRLCSANICFLKL
ncbi:hypothetical protein BN871_AI_00710 [Paenibacillus sp. P22]|nr:hypothetical protein BN871_AI_00710 [Paenibacillus sp. P22]